MSERPILQVWGAEHRFDDRVILRGVDLRVQRGEIYALLGPNGAGKSTLVRAVCGRLKLTGGEVALDDRDPWTNPAARSAVGFVPQDIALYGHLTVRENLETFGRLSGVKGQALQDAVRRALALTRTEDRADMRVSQLSGGYKRRVNIGAAILHQPKLLILDEPTVGVDIDARAALDSVIRSLRDTGTAVLVITHDLDQAGGLADRVGFLREGRKVLEGAPRHLIEQAFGSEMEILVELSVEPDMAAEIVLSGEGLTRRESDGLWIRLDEGGYAAAGALDKRLRGAGVIPREVRVREPSLQNLFTLVADWRRAA